MATDLAEATNLPASGLLAFKVLSLLWSSEQWNPPAVFTVKTVGCEKVGKQKEKETEKRLQFGASHSFPPLDLLLCFPDTQLSILFPRPFRTRWPSGYRTALSSDSQAVISIFTSIFKAPAATGANLSLIASQFEVSKCYLSSMVWHVFISLGVVSSPLQLGSCGAKLMFWNVIFFPKPLTT